MSVIDADPELAGWLTPGEMGAARRDTVVPVQVVNFGAWEPEPPRACGWRHLGYIVLEGILVRDEELAGSTSTELVGPGDLLQPWIDNAGDALVPHEVTWTVLEPARIGVLGPTFVASVARWPVVTAALLGRVVRQNSQRRGAPVCLAIPGQIIALEDADAVNRLATVAVAGVRRRIDVGLIDRIQAGDWVLIHVGFAISRIDEAEAMATHRLLVEMGAEYEQELEELKTSVIE